MAGSPRSPTAAADLGHHRSMSLGQLPSVGIVPHHAGMEDASSYATCGQEALSTKSMYAVDDRIRARAPSRERCSADRPGNCGR